MVFTIGICTVSISILFLPLYLLLLLVTSPASAIVVSATVGVSAPLPFLLILTPWTSALVGVRICDTVTFGGLVKTPVVVVL